MQAFKVQHYERDHPGGKFPAYESLTAQETSRLQTALAAKAGLASSVDPLSLVKHLNNLAQPLEGVNAADEKFDLRSAFCSLAIQPPAEVLVNWYRFDEVDRMRFDDLAGSFSDIWYPGADDLDVLHAELFWILSINHEGTIKCLRFD